MDVNSIATRAVPDSLAGWCFGETKTTHSLEFDPVDTLSRRTQFGAASILIDRVPGGLSPNGKLPSFGVLSAMPVFRTFRRDQ
jgi:hypothetical protein